MTEQDRTGQPSGPGEGELSLTIPKEQAIEQKDVRFLDDTLPAALTSSGNIYFSLPGLCGALGLNVSGQTQRIQRTRSLAKGLRQITLATPGGAQRINCLRLDRIALWIAGMQTNSIKAEYRGKIEAYQDDLAPVATEVFLRSAGVNLTDLVPVNHPLLVELAQNLEDLGDVAKFLREHFATIMLLPEQMNTLAERIGQVLEAVVQRQQATEQQVAKIDSRTQRLTPSHAREVQVLVDRMVRETKSSQTPLTYFIIYGRLKHRFRVGSYSEVPDELFHDVVAFLDEELRKVKSGDLPAQGTLF